MNDIGFLSDIIILLSASVFVVLLFKKLNLSPVLGYFAGGAIIGSHGLGIVSAKDTSLFGEFGIVFLLFAIGLELTFDRLKAMRKQVFGFGTAQVLITAIIIAFTVYVVGSNGNAALIIGGGMALSSTAIVLQVLAESRSQATQVGRLSIAILLMQDFAVVPLLVLVPLLAGESTDIISAMGNAFLKALVALFGIFILGRLFLRPLFAMISSENSAKNNELFVAATLLIALGSAWATEHFGLSLALGAFVAGLLVAETEFQLQAEESITPFKGLFLGLFFMTVGMQMNTGLIIEKLPLITLISLILILVKCFIITILALMFKFNLAVAISAGLLLSQGSEFAFILFGIAADKNIIDSELSQIMLLVVTLTMALTPLLSKIGNFIAGKMDKAEEMEEDDIYQEIADVENHIVIAGFGRVGKMVARLLEAEHIHYVAVDANKNIVSEARTNGFPIYFGDASRLEMLKALGIERAGSVIITIENEITLKKTSKVISQNFPDIPIIVRAKDLNNSDQLAQAGATIIVPETYETGLQLGGAVLKSIGVSEYEISRIKNQFRAGNYVMAKIIEDDKKDNDDNKPNNYKIYEYESAPASNNE